MEKPTSFTLIGWRSLYLQIRGGGDESGLNSEDNIDRNNENKLRKEKKKMFGQEKT